MRFPRLIPTLSLAFAVLAPFAGSAAAQVKVTSVFADAIDAAPTTDNAINQRYQCKPEPTGRYEYLTYVPFDITKPYSGGASYEAAPSGYAAPNVVSADDLPRNRQAGGNADLCFGFTLTPDMQSEVVRRSGHTAGMREDDPVHPLTDDPDTHVAVNGDLSPVNNDDMHHVVVDMPAGFVGSPDNVDQCPQSDFAADLALPVPAASCQKAIVGTAYVRLTTFVFATQSATTPITTHLATGGEPNPASGITGGIVFNLSHAADELGLLGVYVRPATGIAPTKFLIHLKLTPDGRVRAVADAPRNVYSKWDVDAVAGTVNSDARPLPMYVESLGVRAWGAAADHGTTSFTSGGSPAVTYESGLKADFGQWGTNCSDYLTAHVDMTTYNGVESSGTSPTGGNNLKLTGCDALEFRPSIDVTTSEKRPGVPTGTTVRLSLGQNASGQTQTALLRNAKVTLPKGLELGAQVASGADGLKLCSAAQFGNGQEAANTCPAASSAGTVMIKSPLINSMFSGKVYLGEQPAVGELPALYLEASLNGSSAAGAPRIKLVGSVKANDDGTITTSFNDAPQLRFSELQLEFPSGEHALFVTPRQCGEASATSTFTSWAGGSLDRTSSININADCDPATVFDPTIEMSTADTTVGASSPTKITISRKDRSPWLKDVKVSLPTGFLSDLNAASECSKDDAAKGTCPESSRIGTVTTIAGAGPQPLALKGNMYLVARDDGAVAGAAIVVRAKLGELDLGDVVVPARIELRPTDAGLVLTTTAPTRFKNLALLLRTITVDLDREGFPLNPTACGPLRATADLTADTGATASPTSDVTFTGCAARPFQPGIKAELTGALKEKEHPGVHVMISPRKGDSNLKSTTVLLPDGVSSDTKNINGHTCAVETFNAGGCPATTKVGTVKATVSITPDQLTGDVFLVKITGEQLPGIGMSFSGRYTQRVLSRVKVDSATGRLKTVFEAIPDLPLTSLDLLVDGGAASPIQLNSDVCKAPTSWDASFGGQGGQSTKVTIPFDCSTPAPTSTVSGSRKAGIGATFSAPAGRTLKTVKLTLPKGFKLNKSKASLKKNVKVSATGGKVKLKVTTRALTLVAGTPAPTKIKITIKPAGLKGKLKKGKYVIQAAVALDGAATTRTPITVTIK